MNEEIVRIFNNIADILEIKDENQFRVRAYRRAAQNLENLTEDAADLVREKRLNIPGIGRDLAGKIEEITATGKLEYYENLKQTVPPGVLAMLEISGVGPKTAKALFEKLGIDSLEKLEQAAKTRALRALPGFKEKTEENIIAGIAFLRRGRERMLLAQAMTAARRIILPLKELKEVLQISEAGSLRRRRETVRDIDILAASARPEKVMDAFTSLPGVEKIIGKGRTKSTVLTKDGVQVDVRVVEPESFGAALCYFTGSREHNIRLRDLAKRRGLKINEYGVFAEKTGKRIAGKTEAGVYRAVELAYIEPELREDRGEIEAAEKNTLPALVRREDIRADLHVHSRWSDGAFSVEEMARAAQKRGYEYMAVTDHSQGLAVARGLSPQMLRRQIEEIKSLNAKMKNFRIFCGAEVDILSDGRLDFPDMLLQELDFAAAAVHAGLKQNKEQLTMRLCRAMENPYVRCIAHPFGRLINERPAYELDFEKVIAAARRTNTALEINCYAKRLDLDDVHARRAAQAGVMLILGTDSHGIEQMEMIELGISTARRGWLERKNVLNCLSADDFLRRIRKKT